MYLKSILLFFISSIVIVHHSYGAKKETLSLETQAKLQEVFQANESLHQAFFNFSPEKIEKEAKQVLNKMEKIEDEGVKKMLVFSQKKLKEMKKSTPREKLNQDYHLISSTLAYLLKTYSFSNDYSVYHCPMVEKKWIQNIQKMKKVHNPYAPNMPHCGGELGL